METDPRPAADRPGGARIAAPVAAPLATFAVLAGLFALGAVLPVDPDFDVTFGIEAWRRPGVVACAGAALVAFALLANDALAERLGAAIAQAAACVPSVLRVPILLAAAGAAFAALPDVSLSGDAMDVVARTAVRDVQPSNALTSWIQTALAQVLRLDALGAVRAVSCAAGVAGLAAALVLAGALFDDGPRRAAATVLVATTGGAALWFGSVEVYALLGAGVIAYLALAVRALRRGSPLRLAAFALGVAFVLHGAAGLLLPSLAWLAWRRGEPGAARRFAEAAAWFLAPVVAVAAALWIFVWQGAPPAPGPALWGNFLGASGDGPIVPLVADPGLRARYAFLDAEHALAALSVLFVAAPAAWTLLAAGRGRGEPADRRLVVLAVVALVPWTLFPFVWNVSYGLRRDWDLFSAAGFPAALLAAVVTLRTPGARVPAVRGAAVALFTFVPLVVTHAGTTAERRDFALSAAWVLRSAPDPRGAAFRETAAATWDAALERLDPDRVVPRIDEADRLAAAGNDVGALALLDSSLTADPSNVFALGSRGLLLLRRGRLDEARRDLEASLRTPRENLRFASRVGLARIALAAGDRAGARWHLERALREDSENPQAGEAWGLIARVR